MTISLRLSVVPGTLGFKSALLSLDYIKKNVEFES